MFRKTSYKVKAELKKAFKEDHTPRQIAGSFAIGVFITSLPTLGLGFIVFALMIRLWEWVSNLALFASALVLNPFIKPMFYVSSIALGGLIMGLTGITQSMDPATSVIIYLAVGNLIIAFILAVTSYFLVLKMVEKYEEDKEHIIEEIEEITPIEKIDVS